MQPLANALLPSSNAAECEQYNLEVMLCDACGLAQLKDLVDPTKLFSEYVYFSSNSDTMLKSASSLVEQILPTLAANALVVEIASNDGYLLKNYVEQDVKVLGIDPAENIAKHANENGIPTLCDFFGEKLAIRLSSEGKKADIIHANNVMAHVPDINSFIRGIKTLLKPNGKAIIEVPYFLDLVKNLEFDTVYHEHVYYFSVRALKKVFENNDLEIIDIEKLSIHGGSLRLFVSHTGESEPQAIVQSTLQEEETFGLHKPITFQNFMGQIEELKAELIEKLKTLKSEGAKIAAYGASAKGTTLLNYFGIGKDLLEFVVDRSPAKVGKFTPGKQLEIFSPTKLAQAGISHALLLSWNFAGEIMDQQKDFINKGNKFIIPLPKVKLAP